MIFCIHDLETSGLVIGEARIIEAACVLFDRDRAEIIEQWSSLIYDNSYGTFDSIEAHNAFAVNGISKMTLYKHGMNPVTAFKIVNRYFERADYIVGHNILNFDIPLLGFEAAQFNTTITNKPKFDTRSDIEYPSRHYSKRLSHLCSDFSIPTFDSHRALGDCVSLSKLLKHVQVTDEMLEKSKSPLIKIIGEISFKENEKREEAKKRRFMWDAQNKQWYKLIRECDFDKENDVTSFMIRKVPYDKTT